jgi:CDP-4-dehydro-6-deoxyglucose reductase, E1
MSRVTTPTSEHTSIARREELKRAMGAMIEEYFDLAPVRDKEDCPLSVPLYGAKEVSAALDCLLSQNVTMGRSVRAFEERFADFIGTRHAIMVNSGSSANLLSLAVLSSSSLPSALQPGDEVIVPAVTWPTTVTPVLQHGCLPVLVDVDPKTLNLVPDQLQEALSPRTRAIMPVHLLGNPVNMKPLMSFAADNGLWVVEDTCESLGSSIGGRKVGSIGHLGTFSFYFSHHITTIEGGMVVTNDDTMADLARSMRAHGWTRDMSRGAEYEAANHTVDPRFLFVNVGYNLRPMELQGAFGVVQLDRLEEFNQARRQNARYLLDELSTLSEHLTFVTEQEGSRSTWFGFAVMTSGADVRRRLIDHLEARSIATRPIVAGNLVAQPAFRDNPHRTVGTLEHATRIGECGLFIGNHPDLTTGQLDHIIASFREFYEQ